jgi:hypothetical protein
MSDSIDWVFEDEDGTEIDTSEFHKIKERIDGELHQDDDWDDSDYPDDDLEELQIMDIERDSKKSPGNSKDEDYPYCP